MKSKTIYKDLFVHLQTKDSKSRYTIPEIVSSVGNVEVMELISTKSESECDIRKCFEIAFVKGNVKMVDYLLKNTSTIVVEPYIDQVNELSSFEMLKVLVINGVKKEDQMVLAVQKGLFKMAEFLLDKVHIDIRVAHFLVKNQETGNE